MREKGLLQTIFNSASKPAATFTVVASTDIFTVSAHGLQIGDCVQLTTDGTLPTGLSLLTNYYIINPTTNTFQLSAIPNGPVVDVTAAGSSTNTYHLYGKAIYIGDWKYNQIFLDFSNTPSMVVKIQASTDDTAPDFNAAASATNRWTYLSFVNKDSGSTVAGSTGLTASGVAQAVLELNTHGMNWVTLALTTYTSGNIMATLQVFES